MKKIVLAVMLLAGCTITSYAGFDEGAAAYNAGNYTQALKEFMTLAEQGNATSQYNLGVMYEYGEGVLQNYSQAVSWYRKASEQGLSSAQFNLALMYLNGNGVPQDYTQAVSWFMKAAEQGDAGANYNLAVMYYNGNGVPQDYTQAASWYLKAAEQGHAASLFKLGVMYAVGQGVPQNLVVAYVLFNLAAPVVTTDGAKARDMVWSAMSPAQVAAGQQLLLEIVKPNNFHSAIEAYLKK